MRPERSYPNYAMMKWQPVGFTSKSLSLAECNYTIYNKELLSVICRLEEWRHTLEGTKHTIEILNDHRNLTYFRMAQTLNHRQAWWSLYLSWFDYSLTHRAGKHLAKPNALSRQIGHQVEGEDNESQVMLPTERFASGTLVDRPDPPDEHLQAEDIGIEPSRIHIETGSSEVMDRVHGCTD